MVISCDRPAFLAALLDALAAAKEAEVTQFSAALEQIDLTAEKRPRKPLLIHPAMDHLEALVDQAWDPRFAAAAKDLDWSQVYSGGGIDPTLSEGMLSAQFAGTYGRHPSMSVATGLFLLAPGVHYPLHTHDASEIYLCVSGRLQLCHGIGGAPFDIREGELSLTPSGRAHSLTTYSEPVLLAYVWVGDLMASTWWWEQDETEGWMRSSWKRIPGEPWKKTGTEPLSESQIREASV
jgi:quercetin dioxygenase-like cupin family protein